MMSDRHVWKFDDHRLEELKCENEDDANGLTEESMRHCFEQYARSRIAPYFAKFMTDGVCSECFGSDRWECDFSKNEGIFFFRRLRSDTFSLLISLFLRQNLLIRGDRFFTM